MTFSETMAKYWDQLFVPAIFTTIQIVFFTVLIGTIIGFGLAVLLTLYGPNGLNHKKYIYGVLNFLINLIRSFPILILIVTISPLTRLIVGTTLGVKAVIIPLSIAATAFIARVLEGNFISVDKQLIEAARSLGATNMQIMWNVIIKESFPSIVSTITLATINNIASTTIAAAVGGGGLGAIALTYGYQSFNDTILYTGVVALLIMVNIVQFAGEWIYKRML